MRLVPVVPSALILGLLLACNGNPPSKEVTQNPTPDPTTAPPQHGAPSLEKVLAGDPTLDHPAVREAVLGRSRP